MKALITITALVALASSPPDLLAAESNLALDQAARSGDAVQVRRLLSQGAAVDELNKWGTTALTGAAGGRTASHTEIVRALLAHGADVNNRVAFGTTALHEAAFWGNEATVRLLLTANADPNIAKENGWTPLISAAGMGHVAIVKLLIEAGANVDAKVQGRTALHVALDGGHREVAQLLSASGAQIAPSEPSDRARVQPVLTQTAGLSAANRMETWMDKLLAIDFVLGVLITWAIGLTPPVLIRYVFLRRPVGNWPAIGLCAIFWIFNLMLFVALGSQSRTHGALVLIAFVSYWILRRGPRPALQSG